MRNCIVIFLLLLSFSGFARTIPVEDAGLSLSIPDDWDQGYSEEDGSYYASSPDDQMIIIVGVMGKSELMHSERSELIHKVIMEWDLSFEVSEEEEADMNGIPVSIAYGGGVYDDVEVGGCIMLLEVEQAEYMGLVMIFGTEAGWTNYEDAVVELFVSFTVME